MAVVHVLDLSHTASIDSLAGPVERLSPGKVEPAFVLMGERKSAARLRGTQQKRSKGNASPKSLLAKERLRKLYQPDCVRILFVGEAPPASGRFFYQADSGLYRAIEEIFVAAFPYLRQRPFLDAFQFLGCYLVDLCAEPVDKMDARSRKRICAASEVRLSQRIRKLNPEIIVALVRSIESVVRRAEARACWSGLHLDLPYPGRWHHYRKEFRRKLVPLLRAHLKARREVDQDAHGPESEPPFDRKSVRHIPCRFVDCTP